MQRLISSLILAVDIVIGSLKLLWSYPILITPLFPVFLMIIGVEFGIFVINNLFLQLILIFVVAFGLMFSFTISSHMLKQIHLDQKPTISEAIVSQQTVSMIPKVFILTLIWYTIILILVAIELAINSLLSRSRDGDERVGSFVSSIFGTVADALRMMGFILIPIMLFEDIGLADSFSRLKSILKENPITALGGLALTKTVTALIFFIVMAINRSADLFSPIGLVIMLALVGVAWIFSMYLEQIFVTGLYLYTTYPQSKIVGILLGKHIGRELPVVTIPEAI